MSKKIIFFDIDGTIIDEDTGKIPDSTIEALKSARNNGHICIINTGRPISSVNTMFYDYFDGFICGCGTNIYYHDKEIFHALLDEESRKNIIHLTFQCKVDNILEGKAGTFYPVTLKNAFVRRFLNKYKEQGFHVLDYKQNDDYLFDKFTVWYDDESDIEYFKNAIKDQYTIIQRDIDFIEVVPKSYSKASGIQMLIDYLGMSIDDTISIGDSTNDLSMLTYTKESVAMGNANPVLFDQVTYITTDIKKDGIKNALKHFKVIE